MRISIAEANFALGWKASQRNTGLAVVGRGECHQHSLAVTTPALSVGFPHQAGEKRAGSSASTAVAQLLLQGSCAWINDSNIMAPACKGACAQAVPLRHSLEPGILCLLLLIRKAVPVLNTQTIFMQRKAEGL